MLVGFSHRWEWVLTHHEVRDDVVSTPLADEGHTDDHGQAVSSLSCIPQLSKVPPCAVVPDQTRLLDDLLNFELDDWRVHVTVSMVFSKNSGGFFESIVSDEPSR